MDLKTSIRFYRERANMYQADLGRALGVSAQAVSKWELGKSEPDRDCILKMCALFGITADDLLGREDNFVQSQEKSSESQDWPWPEDDEQMQLFGRALRKMSAEKREKVISMAKVMFAEDFDDPGL